ncbi:MAG: AMP-binding protein [Alphaproteobacteria bacterium]|nr:AMP-binding protein [Alphaproteobacteria bacterium]
MSLETETPWVDGLTIGEVLRRTAKEHAGSDALVFPQLSLRYSWKQFDDIVDETAKGLLAIGIRRGHHVAVWGTNVPEWAMLQLATARIGAVLVTINPAYQSAELEYVLKQSDNVALFLIEQFKTSNYHDILNRVCPELAGSVPGKLDSKGFPCLKAVVNMRGNAKAGMLSWQDVLMAGGAVSDDEFARAQEGLSASDAINIQYTSGTTGFPKAATLTHRNILMNAYYVTGCQNITHLDRMCIPVPYYHCFGLVMGTLGAVTRGAAMIIPAEYFSATATLDAIEKERATTVYGVPTMFIAMLEDPSFATRNLKSLRSGIMAGSPCPIEVMRKVIDVMGVKEVTIAYGLTEAAPVITQTRVEDPIELRVETVGRPLPGVAVRLVNSETGGAVEDGHPGELWVKSHGVMLGYYKNPEATSSAIDSQGWLRTGDLATHRGNGYYSITGRLKDMVIRGGENIYPREIEEHLFTHPHIEQAAVVGLPDKKYGEELCAWVCIKAGAPITEDDVKAHCKGQLAHYKVPRYVKFVDSFPQTVSGKIQKFKIREQMIAELGLNEEKTA